MKKSSLKWCILFLFLGWGVACSKHSGENDDSYEGRYKSATVQATEYDEWAYFDFETGKINRLKIKGMAGAVTGVYGGIWTGTSSSIVQNSATDTVGIVITEVANDSLSITFNHLLVSPKGMGATGTVQATLTAKAYAVKQGDKWLISSKTLAYDLEREDKTVTEYNVGITGEVGTSEGSAFSINLFLCPSAMGTMMNMGGTLTGKVGLNKLYMIDGDETSFSWDIAFHKYDIRTNGGSAVKMTTKDMTAVTAVPTSGFESDAEGAVMADLSQMMTAGFVGYQDCMLNKVLCGWVTATPTGTMPPYTYQLNNQVFVVKTAAGTAWKVQFTDMTNEKDKAVYARFYYDKLK